MYLKRKRYNHGKQICVEGHGDERHDGISDASLMDDILNGKNAASSFLPGLYGKIIEQFIKREAPAIVEFAKGNQGDTLEFYFNFNDDSTLGGGYAINEVEISRKSSSTATIVLCLNEKGNKYYNEFVNGQRVGKGRSLMVCIL